MKKLMVVAISLALLVCASTSFAQFRAVGVGGGVVLPSGSFSNFAGSGVGINVRGQYVMEDLDDIVFTGAVGYHRFGSKDWVLFGAPSGYQVRYTLIPISSGGRYYIK